MNTRHFPTPRPWLGASLLSALLGACSYSPTVHEQALGNSVRQAQTLQAVQPADRAPARGDIVTDGIAAAHGVDRYHQSFARPPAPLTVLNIQAGGGGGAQAMPAMPR